MMPLGLLRIVLSKLQGMLHGSRGWSCAGWSFSNSIAETFDGGAAAPTRPSMDLR